MNARLEWLLDYPRFFIDLISGKRTRSELSAAKNRNVDIAPYVPPGQTLRVLDLGSGQLQPQFLILQSAGHTVYGLDMLNRQGGLKAMLYQIARGLFKLHLRRNHNGRGILICGDAGNLPFAAASFDLVTSIAAFEHFLDIPAVVRELARVLAPNGICWIYIHLFTSLSGGHNINRGLNALETLPAKVEPWDHLRNKRLPFTVPLNRLRIREYQEIFRESFEILKCGSITQEGGNLLTPQVRAELKDYSEEELTSPVYLIMARKR